MKSYIWLGNPNTIESIEQARPLAGETVQIKKKQFDTGTRFFICKNDRTIATLSKPANTSRVSSKILQKEKQGYQLQENCIIEEVVYWSDPNDEKGTQYKEILCRIRMTLTD